MSLKSWDVLKKAFADCAAPVRRQVDKEPEPEVSEKHYQSTRMDVQVFLHSGVWLDIKQDLEDRFVGHLNSLSGVDADQVSKVGTLQGQIAEIDYLLHLPERIIMELEDRDESESRE